jgi:hypothetical protein
MGELATDESVAVDGCFYSFEKLSDGLFKSLSQWKVGLFLYLQVSAKHTQFYALVSSAKSKD